MSGSNDAVRKVPTIEEEMASFKGFATKDSMPLGPDDDQTTDEEKAALAARTANDDNKDDKSGKESKPAAKASKLTDEESNATISALDEKLGREATDKEISDALAAALAEKNKPAAGEKPKKSVQDRINKSIRAQRAAERRADAAEARANAAEARLAHGDAKDLTGDTKKANDATEAAPDPKKFEFGELDADYIRALARYEAKQEFAAQTENQKKTQLTAAQRDAAEKFDTAKAAFEEAGADKYDDFEEVVMQGARDKVWPLSDSLGELLISSEYGIDIAYSLASDPKQAKEIFGKTALQQAAWLGRQEAKLSAGTGATEGNDKSGKSEDGADKSNTERKVSKAPAPVQRARGQGSNSSVPGDTSDFAAFEAAAMAPTRR